MMAIETQMMASPAVSLFLSSSPAKAGDPGESQRFFTCAAGANHCKGTGLPACAGNDDVAWVGSFG